MITITNYYDEIKDIKQTDLPDTLQKGWAFVDKVTMKGSSWDAYNQSDSIKKTVDLYLQKLNEFRKSSFLPEWEPKEGRTSSKKTTARRSTPKKTASKAVSKRQTATKTRTASSSKPKIERTKKVSAREIAYQKAEKVEKISEEIRMIKRFALIHDKVKTKNQIRLFLNTLQKAIMEKRIRKTSTYAKQIIEIQDSLISLMGKYKGDEGIRVEISEKKRSEYLVIIGKQAELYSVKFIKSYINLQGKLIPNAKAKNLFNKMARAINSGKLSAKDRYWKEIDTIMSSLKTFVKKNQDEGTLLVSSKELNGLQGIVLGCPCDESPSLNGIQSIPRNTIMNSTDVVNLDFQKLGFTGKWLKLIGDPSSGFTAMIFGKPKMGKSYLAVDFAGYLARNHGTVLYVAREEGIDDTLQQKLKDKNVAHPDLYVSDYLPGDLSDFDFVFLDSVNKLGLTPEDVEELRFKYPESSFVFVFQTTKQGNFRGGNEFQHDVDVVIEVPEKGKAVQFGRFNQGGAINIFS